MDCSCAKHGAILCRFARAANANSMAQRSNKYRGFLANRPRRPTFAVQQFLEGGDPVSHCHDLRTSEAANWILLSKDSAA
jgi:hypothetical protein